MEQKNLQNSHEMVDQEKVKMDQEHFVSFTVDADAGLRIDKWLSDRMPDRARNQIQNDLEQGRVQVNGETQPSRYKVRAEDRIDYALPEVLSLKPLPEDIPLNIVYEDEDMMIIDKPTGLVVHPAPGHAQGTLVNALLHHCGPALEGIGTDETRWGIVHRLDALTSGLMMVAKTNQAFTELVKALSERRVRRQYLGLAVGVFSEDTGTIDKPIGRRANDRKKMGIIEIEKGGREARTDWNVLWQENNMALLALLLHSGRTHQIRVHLQSIGRPIVADPEYGWTKIRTLQDLPRQTLRSQLAVVWPDRQMLHAARLTLRHPCRPAKTLDFISQPPLEMTRMMDILWGEPWRERLLQWQQTPVELPLEPEKVDCE